MRKILSIVALFQSTIAGPALSTVFADTLKVSKEYGAIVSSCRKNANSSAKQVWLFKQWHLSPSVDTKKNRITDLPQAKNQIAIYRQLEKWVQENKVKTILGEGCSGKIDEDFSLKFNGWDYRELKAQSDAEKYSDILTHIPLKLEAKFRSALTTVCADSDELVKKEGLAFSDARGMIGYYTRILALKDDPKKIAPYIKDVIDILHLPKDTTTVKVIPKIKEDLQRLFLSIRAINHERNLSFAKVIKSQPDTDLALVIGGLHAKDLVSLLESENISCTVVEPVGYDKKSEALLDDLEKTLD